MTKTFVLHDETVNTYGFRMLTDGANLEHFKNNPVMLYNHRDYDYPIGRWENIRIEGGKILADAVFNEHTEEGAKVAKMVEDNFLRMASIGAWAPEEVSSDPAFMLDGQTLPTVTKWTIREASIVNIGANHYALAFYDRNTNDIIQLSDKAVLSKYISTNDNDDSINNKTDNKMSLLNTVLKLSDTATEQDRLNAVNALIKNNDDLGKENKELKEKLEAKEKAEQEARKAEAVTLADAAIKEGKFDASKKDALLKMFDNDFDNTKAMLEGIPARQSVADKITAPNSNLGDLANKSWDELDKANKLIYLKDNHFEVFKEKYQAKFGREYKE